MNVDPYEARNFWEDMSVVGKTTVIVVGILAVVGAAFLFVRMWINKWNRTLFCLLIGIFVTAVGFIVSISVFNWVGTFF